MMKKITLWHRGGDLGGDRRGRSPSEFEVEGMEVVISPSIIFFNYIPLNYFTNCDIFAL